MKHCEKVKALALTLFTVTFVLPAAAEPTIDSSKAAFYVGSEAMVCGKVVEMKKFSKGTYLNLGGAYPNQHLSAIVWGSDDADFESRFGDLKIFQGQRACVRGLIESYKKSLQIKVTNPQFLRLMK